MFTLTADPLLTLGTPTKCGLSSGDNKVRKPNPNHLPWLPPGSSLRTLIWLADKYAAAPDHQSLSKCRM